MHERKFCCWQHICAHFALVVERRLRVVLLGDQWDGHECMSVEERTSRPETRDRRHTRHLPPHSCPARASGEVVCVVDRFAHPPS